MLQEEKPQKIRMAYAKHMPETLLAKRKSGYIGCGHKLGKIAHPLNVCIHEIIGVYACKTFVYLHVNKKVERDRTSMTVRFVCVFVRQKQSVIIAEQGVDSTGMCRNMPSN